MEGYNDLRANLGYRNILSQKKEKERKENRNKPVVMWSVSVNPVLGSWRQEDLEVQGHPCLHS